jgi:hypothetical protein
MNDEKFGLLALAHKNAIYVGKWSRTPYSVTVRYKQCEVSISAGGFRQKDRAKALLVELIENDAQTRRRDVFASVSPPPERRPGPSAA